MHPTQVSEWKKAFLAGAGSVFESQESKDDEAIRQKIKEDRLTEVLKGNLNLLPGRTERLHCLLDQHVEYN